MDEPDLYAAVTAPTPAVALERLARRQLAAGAGREAVTDRIADLLPALRRRADYADAWDDAVAELVDRLTGWTRPEAQITATEQQR